MMDDYSIDCSKGLHRLKGDLTKRHMARQCTELVNGLDEALGATQAYAPLRTHTGYIYERRSDVQGEEARWERAMVKQWSSPDAEPVAGAWHRIVACQVPLNERREDGAGEIDLLGVSRHGLPVVIELKQGQSTNSPAQMLVQAAAYAVVLRKAWLGAEFGREWAEAISAHGFEVNPSSQPIVVPLVGAAPVAYWEEWIGAASTVGREAWAAVEMLIGALAQRGFPATFVALHHEGQDADGLPAAIRARVLDRFVLSKTGA